MIKYAEILAKAYALEDQIKNIDVAQLAVPESVLSYLKFNMGKLHYVSQCNAYMAFNILSKIKQENTSKIIVDHGAGLGLFSFLIKSLGYESIYHDISEEYVEGAKVLGKLLFTMPDHFVCGDLDKLEEYCNSKQLVISGLASRNVIEHLPDFAQFFKHLSQFTHPGFVANITTSANMHNPFVKRYHNSIHKQFEEVGANVDMDTQTIDAQYTGMQQRKTIIQSEFAKFSEQEILELAKRTRTMIKPEIMSYCDQYIQTQQFPIIQIEDSNTRDAVSGLWVERLVSAKNYAKAITESGFECEFLPGFYNTQYDQWYKNAISAILNLTLAFKSPWMKTVSPFLSIRISKK